MKRSFIGCSAGFASGNKMKSITVDCQNHRLTMELLGLRLRLEKEDLGNEARREIEERIRALETTLQMD